MIEPSRPLVIYHGACKDGFAAAWAYRTLMESAPGVEYLPVQHGEPVPLHRMRDRMVTMLDFCWHRADMVRIARACRGLIVVDHHQTAAEDMGAVPRASGDQEPSFAEQNGGWIIFDMSRSGAGLAWDTFVRHSGLHAQDHKRPWLIDYVEDRDLWRNALPYTREINAYISTLDFNFDAWDAALAAGTAHAILKGEILLTQTRRYVSEIAGNAIRVRFEGYDVPLVNAPQAHISELLNYLATDEPFAIGWWQRSDGLFKYALRSKPDGSDSQAIDVSRLAQRWGGGGHPTAAGFECASMVHMQWAKDRLPAPAPAPAED